MYRNFIEELRESHQRETEKEIEAQSVSPIVSSRKPKIAFKAISHRRSIEDVPPWIGWERILDYYRHCPSQLHKNIFLTLFETGGRVSEVAALKPSNFIWNEEAIKVQGMIVRKWRKHKRRDFLIKIDEKNPLAEDLISFLQECQTEYLFLRESHSQVQFSQMSIPAQHASTSKSEKFRTIYSAIGSERNERPSTCL